jgi:hypothetical protein
LESIIDEDQQPVDRKTHINAVIYESLCLHLVVINELAFDGCGEKPALKDIAVRSDEIAEISHVPERLSSSHAHYGPDNREASAWIALPLRGSEVENINLELGPIDPGANPCVAMGGLIVADPG